MLGAYCFTNTSSSYAPTLKKLKGHISFGLFVRASMCLFEKLFDACHILLTMQVRVSKFHIWIPHGKRVDIHFFFLVRVISLSGVMPLYKDQN